MLILPWFRLTTNFTFCGKYAMMRIMSEVKTSPESIEAANKTAKSTAPSSSLAAPKQSETKTLPVSPNKTSRTPFSKTPRVPLPKATWRLMFNQIVLIFAIGCIFGTYYEEILTLCKNFFATGTIEWFSRRGLVYGPFSPVYGIGAVGIYLAFYRTKASWKTCLFGGALLGGALEYLLSILQEWIFSTRSWDYSDRLLNIDGRTTIPYMVFWGLLVLVAARWLFPLLEGAYRRLSGKWLNRFCIGLAIFLVFDAALSIAATLRQTGRREGNPADTKVEVFLDRHFPDDRLKLIYDNTVYVPEQRN